MKRLAWASFFLIPVLLVGCPDGYGLSTARHVDAGDGEGGGSLDSSSHADADTSDASDASTPRTSALCGVNGRDDCGAFAVCDPALGCVECAADHDCPASEPRCARGTCVGCRVSSDGPLGCGASEACWQSDHECHAPCKGGAGGCPAGSTCDVPSGSCVACLDNEDCRNGICVEHRCVECVDDSTCPSDRPRCRVLTGACVACTANEDCGRSAPICDPGTFACRKGCTTDSQCEGEKKCDGATATCVAKNPISDASTDG